MIKKNAWRLVMGMLAVVMVAGLMAGCATCKGVAKGIVRDVDAADNWFRDVFW